MTLKKNPAAKKVPAKKAAPKKPQAKPRKKRVAPAQDKLTAIGIEAICQQIAECSPLRTIAEKAGVGLGTLITWLAGFPEQYARAREAQAEKFAEDILAIADDTAQDVTVGENGREVVNNEAIARSRLRVDARKWLASKFAPKKYGDKVALGGAEDLSPLTVVVRQFGG
jgi:hypothetical protein